MHSTIITVMIALMIAATALFLQILHQHLQQSAKHLSCTKCSGCSSSYHTSHCMDYIHVGIIAAASCGDQLQFHCVFTVLE